MLLRQAVSIETIDRVFAVSTSAGSQLSLSVPAPFLFLSSAPATLPHGAADRDEALRE